MRDWEIKEQLFDDQIKLVQGMNKSQLMTTLVNLSHALKENHDANYRLLKHAVEAGLTWA